MPMHARCMGRFGSETNRRLSERKRKAPDGAFDRKPNQAARPSPNPHDVATSSLFPTALNFFLSRTKSLTIMQLLDNVFIKDNSQK